MQRILTICLAGCLAAPVLFAQPSRATDPGRSMLPEFRVEANFTGSAVDIHEDQGEHDNRWSLREAGIGLRSFVDPHFRLDVIISGEESAEGSEFGLESAMITWLDAPAATEWRLGKFNTSFGEFNDSDPDEFPQVTAPEMIAAYWGEDDGYKDSGVNFNIYVPNPWDMSNIFWLGIYNGENEVAFHETEERSPVLFARYEFFWELGTLTGMELGFSYLTGENSRQVTFDSVAPYTYYEIQGNTTMFNVHWELDWKDPKRYLYTGLSLLAEYYWQQRKYEEDDAINTAATTALITNLDTEETTEGFYLLADYRLGRNWGVSARYDLAPLREVDFEVADVFQVPESAYTIYSEDQTIEAGSLMLSYYPSRFSTVRYQYSNRNLGGETIHEHWLQLQVLIGFERPDVF